jgi:EamA domain-containing membrane protein RarD
MAVSPANSIRDPPSQLLLEDLLAGSAAGNLLIALGYLGWGTENNLGRLLGEEIPPVTLVSLKALVAGIVACGAFSLGLSLALFYKAMQQIGAVRAGLISSTSTFWGVLGALLLLAESLTPKVLTGDMVMVLGLALFAWDSAQPRGTGLTPSLSTEKGHS